MIPTKIRTNITVAPRRSITTRSQNQNAIQNNNDRIKRKANSPAKGMMLKRSAFGDVTNATKNTITNDGKCKKTSDLVKKVTVQTKILPSVKTAIRPRQNENVEPLIQPVKKIVTRASLRNVVGAAQTASKPKVQSHKVETNGKVKTRLSNEFDKTEDSLYTSALDNLCDSAASTKSRSESRCLQGTNGRTPASLPPGVVDFDKENIHDIHQVSGYAMDIFEYMKGREKQFQIQPYMERQPSLTVWMRSLLVDWMVEVQESFELNHETLYLAVKLVDRYLWTISPVAKDALQLVGAAAMLVACKYDERIPPLLDDFLYICDGAYTRSQLLRMEMALLRACGYDLGLPLSYRFLRRYARCARLTMPTLTLARYVLELSLMDYATVTLSDSKLAAAALYVALRMKHISGWTATLRHYTGYNLDQIYALAEMLNTGLHRKPRDQLSTVRNKYSHKVFYEVAKTPLVQLDRLTD